MVLREPTTDFASENCFFQNNLFMKNEMNSNYYLFWICERVIGCLYVANWVGSEDFEEYVWTWCIPPWKVLEFFWVCNPYLLRMIPFIHASYLFLLITSKSKHVTTPSMQFLRQFLHNSIPILIMNGSFGLTLECKFMCENDLSWIGLGLYKFNSKMIQEITVVNVWQMKKQRNMLFWYMVRVRKGNFMCTLLAVVVILNVSEFSHILKINPVNYYMVWLLITIGSSRRFVCKLLRNGDMVIKSRVLRA